MKNNYLIFASMFLFFCACNKKGNGTSDAPLPNIYVAGGYLSDGKIIPAYWKNGELNQLVGDSISGCAYGIDILGSDVISCGEIKTETKYLAFFVRNDVLDTLNLSGGAYDLATLNGDIYVTGKYYMEDGIREKACYWKNGQQISLPQNEIWGGTNGIFISGNDIFISGYEIILTQSSKYVQYWKNDELHHFPEKFSGITDVFVLSGDLYLPGSRFDSIDHITTSGYWKNDSWNAYPDGNIKCWTTGICVSGSDVYVAGQKGDESGFWKNGVWNVLAINASVNDIAVRDSDVYICGTLENNDAGYWKNGIWNRLGKGVANKILIK